MNETTLKAYNFNNFYPINLLNISNQWRTQDVVLGGLSIYRVGGAGCGVGGGLAGHSYKSCSLGGGFSPLSPPWVRPCIKLNIIIHSMILLSIHDVLSQIIDKIM